MVQLTILYFCLPTLLLAAPVEDAIKQQLAPGLMRSQESYWNLLNADNPGIQLQLRSLDSLGRGHILRSLGEPDSSWLGGGSGVGNLGWRFNGYNGGLKRGGGLDSLGRGNILRSVPDDFQRYLKSLDSLGRGGRPLRRLDSLGGDAFGFQKKAFDSLSGSTFGSQKRNFDEIDNAGFGAFVKKNFDEIDNVGMGFRKRNFDEIDNAGFGAFLKRST